MQPAAAATMRSVPQQQQSTARAGIVRLIRFASAKRPAAFYSCVSLTVLSLVCLLLILSSKTGGYLSRHLIGALQGRSGRGSHHHWDTPRQFRYGPDATLTFKDGRHSLYSDRVNSMSDASLRILFQANAPTEITADCSHNYQGAGGLWHLCLTGPFQLRPPCAAISFGSEQLQDWKLEHSIAERFKCRVFGLDPRFTADSLGGSQTNPTFLREPESISSGYLQRLKARFNIDKQQPIEVLKIDMEDKAWEALDVAAKDESLRSVKQLLLSIPVHLNAANVSIKIVKEEISALASLHQLNFRLWLIHNSGVRQRLHFINTDFVQGAG